MALCWLYVFPYVEALNNPNERTRVMQARAIVEYGQLAIGRVVRDPGGGWRAVDLYGGNHPYDAARGMGFVEDVGLVCTDAAERPPGCAGRIYPAKSPGTTLIGVPVLSAMSALGLVPAGKAGEARATWILRYGAVAPLMLAALWLLGWLLRQAGVSERIATGSVLTAGLGTSIFPYAISAVGHALAGAALLAGIAALIRARRGPHTLGWALAGGWLTASAVLFEYHAAVAAACVAVWVVASPERRRLLPGFAASAALAAVILGTLHQAQFGSPLETGHMHLMSASNRTAQAGGFLGIDGVYPRSFAAHLFDPYVGLVTLMPWLGIAGAVGFGVLVRREVTGLGRGAQRALAAIPLVYLLFVTCLGQWRNMNGWSIGPRYLVPCMLPLALCAGVGWERISRSHPRLGVLTAGLAVAGIGIVTALTVSFPAPPAQLISPFGELAVPLLRDGWFVPNAGDLLGLGAAALVPLWLMIGGAMVWLLVGPERRWGAIAGAAGLALVWWAALGAISPSDDAVVAAIQASCRALLGG